MFADLLGALAPRDCVGCGLPSRDVLCKDCDEALPWAVWPMARLFEGCDAAWFYGNYDGPVGGMARRAKYRPDPSCARALAGMVSQAVRGRVPAVDAVVPVPQTRISTLQRGFSPVRTVAASVARELGVPLVDSLERTRGVQQAGLDPSARAVNAHGSYESSGPAPRRVLLVDDVVTSGATVSSCAQSLLGAGAENVYVLAVCDALS
ncbi:MAG: ComF family protein [Proteobacteria bacterium]|nr:ComF family protein [Pseudomonadota bacterium]MCP4920777.1 ComF family protein [Pseudomonadota bacterium]